MAFDTLRSELVSQNWAHCLFFALSHQVMVACTTRAWEPKPSEDQCLNPWLKARKVWVLSDSITEEKRCLSTVSYPFRKI